MRHTKHSPQACKKESFCTLPAAFVRQAERYQEGVAKRKENARRRKTPTLPKFNLPPMPEDEDV